MQVIDQRQYHPEEYGESVSFVQEAVAKIAEAVAWELKAAEG